VLEVFRMGWYPNPGPEAAGARLVYTSSFDAPTQPSCPPSQSTGLVECHWGNPPGTPTKSLQPDQQFLTNVSGYYLVRLTAGTTLNPIAQSYIIFVIRDDNRPAMFLMNSAVTTYQAYNCWGPPGQERSLYPCQVNVPVATQVSFDRPYTYGQGTGLFFDPYALLYDVTSSDPGSWPWTGFEYPMVRFLERGLPQNGDSYDVKYATDIDLQTDNTNPILNNAGAFLSVGHDEYWSKEMHGNLIAARDRSNPMNIAFFSGNTSYWIITVLQSTAQQPNRIIETHKDKAQTNPVWAWSNCSVVPSAQNPTCPGEHSEQTLVGSITTDGSFDRGDFQVTQDDVNATDWLFVNAGLDGGGRLPGMIGYEAQTVGIDPNHPEYQPPNQKVLANSQFKSHYTASQIINPPYPYADMSLYPSTTGALVLSTGSIDWSLGLDIYTTDFPSTNYLRVHPAIAQITRNVLHKFGDLRDPGKLSAPAYAVSIVSSQGGQVCVQYTRPAGRPQGLFPDFIALHQVNVDDDLVVSYRSQSCNNLTADAGSCCISGFQAGLTYTADYVTLDKHWQTSFDQQGTLMRTLWRAAKSLQVTP